MTDLLAQAIDALRQCPDSVQDTVAHSLLMQLADEAARDCYE